MQKYQDNEINSRRSSNTANSNSKRLLPASDFCSTL